MLTVLVEAIAPEPDVTDRHDVGAELLLLEQQVELPGARDFVVGDRLRRPGPPASLASFEDQGRRRVSQEQGRLPAVVAAL